MPHTNQQLRGTQLALWLASELIPINFTLTARVRGTFYADQLQSALEKLKHKYPPLTMRVKSESKGKAYLVSDSGLKIPVRRVEQKQANSWMGEVTAELVRGFDSLREPPIRIVWVQGPEFSDLIFVCNHALADGFALAYLIRDLLTFLSDLDASAEPLPVYPPLSELIPDFSGRQTVVWQSKVKSAIFKILLSLRPKDDKSPLTDPAAAKADYHLLHWDLSPEQTTALVSRSRGENTTVHAALCTAFLRAFGEFYGNGWKRTIQSPINLRNRLTAPVGETFGLYINLVEFPVDCAPEHKFWDVARTIKQGFVQHSSDKSIFRALVDTGIFIDALAPMITPAILIQSVAQVKYDLSITNLGALPFPTQFGALQLEAIFGPCISGKRNEVILSVNTVNNKMHLTLIFTDVKLTTAQAEGIKEKAMQWLSEAVGTVL